MSPQVHVLPQTLINKIAAGEVIVRPASVVKELVENSFDAEAHHVRVEVSPDCRNISVIDDGCGMDEQNARRATLRHSTSKITEFEDLETLLTRGFRGEALASIISVSRFELITRRPCDMAGTRIVAAGGQIERAEPAGAAPGTAIHVRELFYNTPARLKFLKTARAEFAQILQTLTQQALSRHEIGVVCARGDETKIEVPAGQTLRARIENLLGVSGAQDLIEVDYERDGVGVHGYVSRPDAARKDRRWQFLMVNGRPISSRQLTYPLQEAYRGLLMQGRFPLAVLDIVVNLAEVDVNVHPTKEEVRFEDERKVGGLLHRAVSEALYAGNLIPSFGAVDDRNGPKAAAPQMAGQPTAPPEATADGAEPPALHSARQPSASPAGPAGPTPKAAASGHHPAYESVLEDPSLAFILSPRGVTPVRPGRSFREIAGPGATTDLFPPSRLPVQSGASGPAGAPATETPPADEGMSSEPPQPRNLSDGPPPEALGQVADSYILAEWGEDLLLVDQHAAHERLLYDSFRQQSEQPPATQPLLLPVPIEVAPAEDETLLEMLPVLLEHGIDIERESPGRYVVRSVPSDCDSLDVGAVVRDILDEADGDEPQGKPSSLDDLRDRLRIRMACHAAIKANQRLSPEEMDALLARMVRARLSFTCPHGRPTMILLRKDQIDRQFGRR